MIQYLDKQLQPVEDFKHLEYLRLETISGFYKLSFSGTLIKILQNVLELTMTFNYNDISYCSSALFISFVHSNEIELSNCISGSIYSNPLLANLQKSVTSVFQDPKRYYVSKIFKFICGYWMRNFPSPFILHSLQIYKYIKNFW